MEGTSDVTVSNKKSTRSQKQPFVALGSPVKPTEKSGKLIPNGTGDSHSMDLLTTDSDNENSNLPKITKATKSPKSKPVEDRKSPRKKSQEQDITASPSSSREEFQGFDDDTLLNEQESGKRKNFFSIIEHLKAEQSASTSGNQDDESSVDEDVDDEVKAEEEMTVDVENASDTDSNRMEIDMGNDSEKGGDKNMDSDTDSMQVDSVKKSVAKPKLSRNAIKTNDAVGETSKAPMLESSLKGAESGAKVEFCGHCSAEVDDAEEGICCDGNCERWFHLRCSGLSQAEYNELSLDENAKWACSKCSGKPPPIILADAKPLIQVRKDLANPMTTPKTPLAAKRKSVASKEGKTPKIDVANPAFLKPFDFGWKRELVYRSTNENTPNSRRQGDIYYYTPQGKKLRSLREIADHVAGTDLTLDNFTFWKEPLGIDPEKEIIRDAKYKLNNKDPSIPSPVPKKVPVKIAKTPKTTPKLTATVTPLDSSGETAVTPKASASVTPRVVFKGRASLGTGPKVKVVPNRSATPQVQKTAASKVARRRSSVNKRSSVKPDGPSSATCESSKRSKAAIDKELVPDSNKSVRSKFRRYGLLANAKAQKDFGESSSDSSDVDSSPEIVVQTERDKRLQNRSENAANFSMQIKPAANRQSQVGASSDVDHKRSSPEMEFRPVNPSSYGCQTSHLMTPRVAVHQYSTNTPSPFETILIVDKLSASASYLSPAHKSSESPLMLNNDEGQFLIQDVVSLNCDENVTYPHPTTSSCPSPQPGTSYTKQSVTYHHSIASSSRRLPQADTSWMKESIHYIGTKPHSPVVIEISSDDSEPDESEPDESKYADRMYINSSPSEQTSKKSPDSVIEISSTSGLGSGPRKIQARRKLKRKRLLARLNRQLKLLKKNFYNMKNTINKLR